MVPGLMRRGLILPSSQWAPGDIGPFTLQSGEELYFSSHVWPLAAGSPRGTAMRPSLKLGPFEGSLDIYWEARNPVQVTHKAAQLKAIYVLINIPIVWEVEMKVTDVSFCPSLRHRVKDARTLFKKTQGLQPCFCRLEQEESLIRHSHGRTSLPRGVAVGDESCMVCSSAEMVLLLVLILLRLQWLLERWQRRSSFGAVLSQGVLRGLPTFFSVHVCAHPYAPGRVTGSWEYFHPWADPASSSTLPWLPCWVPFWSMLSYLTFSLLFWNMKVSLLCP